MTTDQMVTALGIIVMAALSFAGLALVNRITKKDSCADDDYEAPFGRVVNGLHSPIAMETEVWYWMVIRGFKAEPHPECSAYKVIRLEDGTGVVAFTSMVDRIEKAIESRARAPHDNQTHAS